MLGRKVQYSGPFQILECCRANEPQTGTRNNSFEDQNLRAVVGIDIPEALTAALQDYSVDSRLILAASRLTRSI